jgi:tetratricopeptide (TPR) repeat protein
VDALIGDCWTKLGDDEQALRAYGRAEELQSNSSQGVLGISHVRLLQGDFDEARKICRGGGNRGDINDSDRLAAQIEFFARNFSAAEQIYDRLDKSDAGGGGTFYGAVSYKSALGRAKQALGDSDGARLLLEGALAQEKAALERTPENADAAYRLAAVEASVGLLDAAFRHLRQAIASGWLDYRSLELDPRFDALRSDPELQMIIKDVSVKVADMRLTTRRKNN